MPTSQPLCRVRCSSWAPGQQPSSSDVWDAFLGQRESSVAALWLGKQAAGFEVPGGFAQAGVGRLKERTASLPQAWLCLLSGQPAQA